MKAQISSRSAAVHALRIVFVYAVVGALWILLSDEAAALLFRPSRFRLISELKGLMFVLVTSGLLYFFLFKTFQSIEYSRLALTESEQKFSLFMENLPAAAFLKQEDGKFLYVNTYWEKVFADGRDAVGRKAEDFFPKADWEAFLEDDIHVLETGQKMVRTYRENMRGEQREWLLTRFPVSSEKGRPRLIGGFLVEISEQKHLEEQLRHAEKMEAIGKLAGGVAHDFNNMLTVINGYAEVLTQKLAGTSAERPAQEIRSAGEKAAGLTRQLLAFSRRQILQMERLNLSEMITEMRTMLVPALGASIQFELDLADGLPDVKADRHEIEQVVLNLAVNARDAMPHGGTLRISTRSMMLENSPESTDEPFAPGPYVELAIADTGQGMDELTLARIFEPFYTTKEQGRGTGLGLSTAYGTIRQSGGVFRVESAPGEGSTFRIYLPALRSNGNST